MKILKTQSWMVLCAVTLLLAGQAARAQQVTVPARVVEAVDDTRTVQLKGNVHPLARAANDQGALPDSQPLTRMLLLLQRSDAQEASLRQLMDAQQTKGSSSYHAWLTPEQFGKQYGPADADVQAVTDWLTGQGFQVAKVAAGRTVIEFSGNVAQVRNAFHTEIHKYAAKGEEHFANTRDPAIPEALAPVVKGVVALHNFRSKAAIHRVGTFRRNAATGQVSPLFTFNDVNGTFYAVGPGDFATIYNVPATATGSGQSIAIVGRSNINIQDVRDFRSIFGLPANDPQIILNGPDPGLVSGDEGESDLDVEWAGAVAPAAQIIFVTTQGTQTDFVDGIDASAIYIVDNNVAPVLSESYGSCESNLGANGNAFYSALWQQAAAEGITVVVAAGDNGSAGCDDASTQTSATSGLAVSGIASTPYNIAMGGTDFNYAAGVGTYWDTTAGTVNSAKSYIPETTWNDSCAAAGLSGCSLVTSGSSALNIAAGSGGPSNCGVWNPAGTACTGYPKPKWQTGFGDANRDLPDVSLFSGDGLNGSFFIVCESDQDIAGDTGCNLTKFTSTSPYHDFQAVGGTSAATPTFAAIIALINAKTGQRQGIANYELYSLANTSGVFHDITTGNNSVPCPGASTDCSKTSSGGFGVITTTPGGNTIAYAAGTGYDLATGLGSVNVTNLLAHWASAIFTGTTTSLNPISSPPTLDVSVSVSGSVTKSAGSGTPTGVVTLENAATNAPIDSFTLDGSGNFSGSTTFLPAGNYSVKAHYGGDGTFGPSDSGAVAVTVAKQAGKPIVSWVTFNGTTPVLSTSAQTVAYGSPYILRVDVANGSGTTCQNVSTGAVNFVCPTGTVQLFNHNAPLPDFANVNGTPNPTSVAALNDRGFAEDQAIQLAPGTYAITATYAAAANSSYNSSNSSNTLSVTISKATPTGVAVTSNLSSITSGASVVLTAQVQTNSNGAGPSGSVSFTNGSTSLGSATCVQTSGAQNTTNGTAYCTATLSTAISGLYPPPAGGPRGPGLPVIPMILALASLLLFALGLRWVPARRRRAFAVASLVAFVVLAGVIAGCGGGSSGGGGGGGGGGTRTINATYPGDSNYSSSSGSVSITVN
ncbi:MAG: protease pro-enzyme activation domain-containing protein [Candidatus Acidiferrum sp.]|jgi:hypothetical protein